VELHLPLLRRARPFGPGCESNFRPHPRKLESDRAADSPSGAGHDGYFSFNVCHDYSPWTAIS
jgi:hypothetical protein